MRLSIEIPEHKHQQIKAMAALYGLSIKDYILQRALPVSDGAESNSDTAALAQLEALLAPRIEAAESGDVASRTIEEIVAEANAKRIHS
jgi:hypothetical protein